MSKALSKNVHWLPKRGSYTIRLNRRGDIGQTLPRKAIDAVYEVNEQRRQGLVNALRIADKELAEARAASRALNGLRAQYCRRLNAINMSELAPEKHATLKAADDKCREARVKVAELQNELKLVNSLLTPDGRSPNKVMFEKSFVAAAHVLLDSGTFKRILVEAERIRSNAETEGESR